MVALLAVISLPAPHVVKAVPLYGREAMLTVVPKLPGQVWAWLPRQKKLEMISGKNFVKFFMASHFLIYNLRIKIIFKLEIRLVPGQKFPKKAG